MVAAAVARVGTRPAWMSVWARWRETEIHHVDLDVDYTHSDRPSEFVDLMFPRVLPTLDARLTDEITVQVQVTDRHPAATDAAATTADDLIVRGSASAALCWLVGRPIPSAAGLTVSRSGQPWPLPRLRPWT
jgi:maleylpyruvate isomerase